MEPIKGGFFDPVVLGGFHGTKWGHVPLSEPVVNPVFENAVRKLTGLGTKFDDIMSGKLHLHEGEFNTEGKGLTGGAAIEKILKGMDIEKEKDILLMKSKKAKGAILDDINKKLRYITALQTAKLSPHEAYIRRSLPVLPPIYRPVYSLPDGSSASSGVNYLYQNTGIINTMMKLPVMKLLPEEDKAEIRKDLYEHVQGVSGLTDLNIRGKEREGFISEIKGGSGGQPKEGFFMSKLISKKQDYVGRGTIIPEPDLGIDEVAMPEEMAWKLFEPFLIRELKTHGKSPLEAKEEIKNKSLLAKKALEIVMKERHVLLNRAPSLHKFSIMAFKPKITEGRAIKIPPLIVDGFNADFDGDTMTVHVPISDEANQEAEKMLPSRNLFQPGTGKLMIFPSQEAQIGLYYLSKTPQNREKINKILPAKYRISGALDKKLTKVLLQTLAKELPPNVFGSTVAALKSEGEKHAYETGFTLGIEDLASFNKDRDAIVVALDKDLRASKTDAERMTASTKGNRLIDAIIEKKLKNTNNPLYDMVESGARGNKSQLRSILVTPLLVSDARGKIVPSSIKKSYAEGLSIGDYWVSMYGARRGMMDRAIQTSLPGAFSKDIMATTLDNVISAQDCGTKDGIILKLDDSDAIDRYLAGEQGGFAHNTLVDSAVISKLKKAGVNQIKVRSPLRCLRPRGTCARCYGIDEHGGMPQIGDNIGAKAGQTISEPLVQMVMETFHTGGAAGTGADVGGYQRINQLLQLPKIVTGAAPLSPSAGVIKKITKGVAGGYDVTINDGIVHVPQGRNLKVKLKQRVNAGDPLSDGFIKPQDLVKYKGMPAAQDYIASELKKAYQNQNVGIHRKIFETVVRSLGNTTQVLNNPKDSDYLPGDVIPYTVAAHHNQNLALQKAVDEAEGYKLAVGLAGLKVGHELTANDIKGLRANGVSTVSVSRDAVKHAPFLKGLSTLPLLRRDWMAALGYRNLAKNLIEGAGQGWKTDLSDYHPIPAFAHGATFGQGQEGRY
jgi:DNA-directed RNA polymerase subunit beta'